MKRREKTELTIDLSFSATYLVLFILLLVSVYCNFYTWLQTIFMALILLLCLAAVFYPLIKKNKVTILETMVVVLCFLMLAAAIISFASVSTGPYRDPIIQISAALLGGGITLYGVGLTIKSNRLERERYEIEKARPTVFPIGENTWKQLRKDSRIELIPEVRKDLSNLMEPKKTDESYSFAPLLLANSDLSMCTLKGIAINKEQCIVFHFDIDYEFVPNGELQSVQLILGDMYGNTYYKDVSFDVLSVGQKKKEIVVMGTLGFVKVGTAVENRFDEDDQNPLSKSYKARP